MHKHAHRLVALALVLLAINGCRETGSQETRSKETRAKESASTSGPEGSGPLKPGGRGDAIAALLDQVRDLLDAGQADSAIAVLAPQLLGSPLPVDPRLTRALVLASNEAKKPWEGSRILNEMLRLRPGDIHLELARGEIELARGRPEVALRDFQRAIVADDGSAEAMGDFGRCRALTGGSTETALAYFDKVSQAKPGLAAPRYGKAALLLEAGRSDDASQELRLVLGINPSLWIAERDLGRALMRLDDRKEAIEHFENAVKLLDAAGDPLMAERMATELRAAAEGAGGGAAPGEKLEEKKEPQG